MDPYDRFVCQHQEWLSSDVWVAKKLCNFKTCLRISVLACNVQHKDYSVYLQEKLLLYAIRAASLLDVGASAEVRATRNHAQR